MSRRRTSVAIAILTITVIIILPAKANLVPQPFGFPQIVGLVVSVSHPANPIQVHYQYPSR